MKNTQLDFLLNRGVTQILPKKTNLSKLISQRKIKVYLGIDPTANTLHLGHSIPLRKLNQFAQIGAEAILLVGDGTVKIGDPTGRDRSRPQLTSKEIESNFLNWKKQTNKILDFNKVKIIYNSKWLEKLNFNQLINLLSKVTTSQLLERDMFTQRQKKNLPIFGHEMIYPLIQGYDSVALDADLEIGGTDQTFNMLMGRTLQKIYHQKEKFILTTPLINGLDGRKMSKSLNNFIALSEEPDTMYGKLMSISDDQIIPYFELLTDTNQESINLIKNKLAEGQNPLIFKKQLAFLITEIYHNSKKADLAKHNFEKIIQNKEIPENLIEIKILKNQNIKTIIKLCGLNLSSQEIKRLIIQNSVLIIDKKQKINHINDIINSDCLLKVGKRNFFKLKIA